MIFTAAHWTSLRELGEVTVLDDPSDRAALVEALPGHQVLVTSWGTIPLDDSVLDHAPELELVAHSAASVKHFVTDDVFARGIRVTQAGAAMALPVAEVALTFTLTMLHRVHRFDRGLRDGAPWAEVQAAPPRHEMAGSVIGVVGASRTGRAYIAMVRALGAEVAVYDPYLDEAGAGTLGVARRSLDEVMAGSRVVVVHAPTLPETHHLVGRRELALMPDGAALVNTARSWIVDEAALLDEVRSGRIDAALDVFDDEPLPVDSPWRTLPNVALTPHQAAGTIESRHRLADIVVEEIGSFTRDGVLRHEVSQAMLARMG